MFDTIPLMPKDPVMGLTAEFNKLNIPEKINLGVGIYRDKKGLSTPFNTVLQVEKYLAEQNLSKDYLPIEGDPEFIRLTSELILGPLSKQTNIVSVQTVGGTSSLNIAARLLKASGQDTIIIPDPTWLNHKAIFEGEGFNVVTYPHLDFEALKKIEVNSVLLTHASSHNPTGKDPSKKGWEKLFKIAKDKKFTLLFDNAYQGFGKGLEEDAWALRKAIELNLRVLVASSFSKNFGLYGERIGLLSVLTSSQEEGARVLSYLKSLIRGIYSNPPLQGERIIKTILENETLKSSWDQELKERRERIQQVRDSLSDIMPNLSSEQGFFSMTGFAKEQIDRLKNEFGIVLLNSGRINLSGLNEKNLNHFKKAVKAVS